MFTLLCYILYCSIFNKTKMFNQMCDNRLRQRRWQYWDCGKIYIYRHGNNEGWETCERNTKDSFWKKAYFALSTLFKTKYVHCDFTLGILYQMRYYKIHLMINLFTCTYSTTTLMVQLSSMLNETRTCIHIGSFFGE